MSFKRILFLSVLVSMFFSFAVVAEPEITFLSPQQDGVYSESRILINITSNETVDFFIKERNNDHVILVEGVQNYVDYLYAKKGTFEYIIWANNSNGVVNASVTFNSSFWPNPISITSCGYLASSHTEYILENDITTSGRRCLEVRNVRNISLDLNEHKVESTYTGYGANAIRVRSSPETTIFNGNISVPVVTYQTLYALYLSDSTVHIYDLNLFGQTGLYTWLEGLLAENIYINATKGIRNLHLRNAEFRNIKIDYSNYHTPYDSTTTGIEEGSTFGEVIFNNLTIDQDFLYSVYYDNMYNTYYMRNTNLDLDRLGFEIWGAMDNRIYKQHLVKVNVTDQYGNCTCSVIEIWDNGNLQSMTEDEQRYRSTLNPNSHFFAATNTTGRADIWLTEELDIYKTGSPLTHEHYEFSPYDLTAKVRQATSNYSIDMDGSNSTFNVDLVLVFDDAESIPDCTLTQNLDLNNDETINIQDALLILRYITGKSVSTNEAKNCNAWSILAS